MFFFPQSDPQKLSSSTEAARVADQANASWIPFVNLFIIYDFRKIGT